MNMLGVVAARPGCGTCTNDTILMDCDRKWDEYKDTLK